MANTTENYLINIRNALESTLNLRYFPSQIVERQVHPEVEFQDNPTLLLDPILISKSEMESCLIEASVNSVRISISIRKNDELVILLTHMLERFMSLRADKFEILRKKAVDGYDFSFLVSADHLQMYKKEELINFIIEFIHGIDKEINDLKLCVTSHAGTSARFFTNGLSNNKLD